MRIVIVFSYILVISSFIDVCKGELDVTGTFLSVTGATGARVLLPVMCTKDGWTRRDG